MRMLSACPNRNNFNILFRHCADFAGEMLDFYYPVRAVNFWFKIKNGS